MHTYMQLCFVVTKKMAIVCHNVSNDFVTIYHEFAVINYLFKSLREDHIFYPFYPTYMQKLH
jgi:hypothetical protein